MLDRYIHISYNFITAVTANGTGQEHLRWCNQNYVDCSVKAVSEWPVGRPSPNRRCGPCLGRPVKGKILKRKLRRHRVEWRSHRLFSHQFALNGECCSAYNPFLLLWNPNNVVVTEQTIFKTGKFHTSFPTRQQILARDFHLWRLISCNYAEPFSRIPGFVLFQIRQAS